MSSSIPIGEEKGEANYFSPVQVPEGSEDLMQITGVFQNLFNEGVPLGAQFLLRTILKQKQPELRS